MQTLVVSIAGGNYYEQPDNVTINNFYGSFTNTGTYSKNIRLSDISTANYFLNYTGHDYHLKTTAIEAIDDGDDVGLNNDIDGTPVPQGLGVDKGAYELIP